MKEKKWEKLEKKIFWGKVLGWDDCLGMFGIFFLIFWI
jgi:hypothetical protein